MVVEVDEIVGGRVEVDAIASPGDRERNKSRES